MNCVVTIDAKFALAIGVSIALIVLAFKVDNTSAAEVLNHATDACKSTLVVNDD